LVLPAGLAVMNYRFGVAAYNGVPAPGEGVAPDRDHGPDADDEGAALDPAVRVLRPKGT
jgi:hypothetical protein